MVEEEEEEEEFIVNNEKEGSVEFLRGHYDDHRNEIYMYFRNPSNYKVRLNFLSESGSKEINGIEYGVCLDLL